MTEEEMKLAPLEEEAPKHSVNNTHDNSPSGELPKIEIKPNRPKKSLIEEELDAEKRSQPQLARSAERRQGDFDPLKPPGFSGPSYGTPAWVFAAIGFGVVLILGVVLFLVFGGS
jgi:hypothetical protein